MQISVDCIDITSGSRAVTTEEIDFMALTIKQVGLLHPLMVIPNGQIEGRYFIVAGRNRLAAVKKLGWEMVNCTVRTVSEADAEMIEKVENLARVEYSQIERDEAMATCVKLYSAAHPEAADFLKAKQVAGLKYRKEDPPPEEASSNGQDVPADPPKTIVAAVAGAMGVKERTVRAAVNRAQKFTDDEKVVLKDRKLSRDRIDTVSKLAPTDKVQVINLLGAGMDYSAAMEEVLKDKFTPDAEDGESVSDEDFLADCPVRKRVNTAKFDADALFYRSVQQAKVAFAKQIGWASQKAKVGSMGVYARRLMLFMESKHPRDWLVCSQCVRGQTKDGTCPQCRGGGYLVG